MSANFEWNRQQAEERPAARRREADEHRLALAAAGQAPRRGLPARLWGWLTRGPARRRGEDSAESAPRHDHPAPPRPA